MKDTDPFAANQALSEALGKMFSTESDEANRKVREALRKNDTYCAAFKLKQFAARGTYGEADRYTVVLSNQPMTGAEKTWKPTYRLRPGESLHIAAVLPATLARLCTAKESFL
jgi:hypothetical protein